MSSMGSQWRAVRHYLSLSNLNAEVEKLLQRLKPASPDHWDNLIQRFEKAISVRLMHDSKELEENKVAAVKSTTVEDAAKEEKQVEEKKENRRASQDRAASLGVESEAQDITLHSFLQGLKRNKDLHFGNISDSSWKSNKPIVNKSSIHSRTSYVISALGSAESSACLAKRIEDFIHHIHRYPEARDLAIREGAVRALLRAQHRARGDPPPAGGALRGLAREALALVGYVGVPRGPGPRILALDGGGIRGLVTIEVLRHLERITGRRVNELFDFVIGVSTGAIIAAVIGTGVGSLETASQMYRTLSREMFGSTSLIGGTSRLVWTHSYYDTEKWEKMLRDNLGDMMLTECNRTDNPKMALVSCAVSPGSRLAPFVFRTYSAGWRRRAAVRGGSDARVWQAVRASAAAPTYFTEYSVGGLVHQDGGLAANNPAGLGVHEARLLWGARALPAGVLVSLGTGAAPAGPARAPAPRPTSWTDKFYTVLESATDTEGVHRVLGDLYPRGRYFRFNPPLVRPCGMDEVRADRLDAMMADTAAYIRRNRHKFERAAALLTRRRSALQRLGDAAEHRALLLGIVDRR